MSILVMNKREGGLFLRHEAIAAGMSDEDLRRGIRAGQIIRVRQGAYACARTWGSLDEAGRHLIRATAVVLTHNGGVALSHVSGAIAHGLRVWGVDLAHAHLVRCDDLTGRSTKDITYHTGGWPRDQLATIRGVPVLDAATCAVGVAALGSIEAGVVTVDSAYDLKLADQKALVGVVDRMRSWPGTRKLQVTMRLAQPGSQSVGESRLRVLCWSGHLPKPVLQYEVRDRHGRLIGVADFAWPAAGVLGEFDGRVKYGRYLRPGEAPGDAVYREKLREDAMREATGWRMLRFTWADLSQPLRSIERIRSALQSTT